MQSKYLETFLAVARTLNFGQAARELNYSQSTVSEHVRLVELELGVRLFERLGRKIFLTSQGERLVGLGARLLQAEDEVRQAFLRQGNAGRNDSLGRFRVVMRILAAAAIKGIPSSVSAGAAVSESRPLQRFWTMAAAKSG